MTQLHLGRGAADRSTVRGSTPHTSPRRSIGTPKRRAVAAALSPLVASAGLVAVSIPAEADVVVGAITAFPDRDMVGVSGYDVGEVLTVKVIRGGNTIGQVTAAAVPSDDGGGGLEINHGPEGPAQ